MAEGGHREGWSEDSLHRWLAELEWPRSLVGSRGHDAAVLARLPGFPVTCTDQCIEGVHVAPGENPIRIGRKAVLRCLSDLAATAAEPVAVTLAVRAPLHTPEDSLRSIILGARAAAVECGAELVAGDLAQGEGPLGVSVSALGSYGGALPPPGRDRAQPGQGIFLSGPVGGSLESGRHLEPRPRFDAAHGAACASALMDVSDGLALDLHRLLRASGCGGVLDLWRVPIHPDASRAASGDGSRALDRALHDGEDHELLATSDGELPAPWVRVGEVIAAPGLMLRAGLDADPAPWSTGTLRGWEHGSRAD